MLLKSIDIKRSLSVMLKGSDDRPVQRSDALRGKRKWRRGGGID